jgi:hypothetical protein
MVLHPTGHDVIANASAGGRNALNMGVHALALLGQALLLTGMLAFTLGLQRRDLGVLAYATYALAAVAVMIAAVASGFLAPAVVSGIAGASESARAGMMGALGYTGLLNEAFARVHVILSGVAMVMWSVAILGEERGSRPLAVYGLLIGVTLPAGVLSGMLRLDIHGFGLVVLTQGVWMVWIARRLWAQEPVR